ncbi:MAG: nucleoside hydrolase [Erysipelotrichaceae bacterium]|nr:nucleoside hydrolase [Erysipelotrichaceae bacterium]
MNRLIIDCDTGIDDSLALLFAGLRKDIEISAVCSVFGNCSAHQAAINTMKILDLIDYPDVPIAIGENKPLVGEATFATHVHGSNGIGDVELPDSKRKLSPLSSVELLLKMVRENPGEYTLITLGRMTNVALALEREPELPKLVKKLIFMGGTIYHEGNVGPFVEANIGGDPLAASKVLSAGFDAIQVGLDVTQTTHLTTDDLRWLKKNCRRECEAAVDYLIEALKGYFRFNHEDSGMVDCCPVHDPLALVMTVAPELGEVEYWPAHVETEGRYTAGQILIDKRLHGEDWPKLGCVLKVDHRKCVETILREFC